MHALTMSSNKHLVAFVSKLVFSLAQTRCEFGSDDKHNVDLLEQQIVFVQQAGPHHVLIRVHVTPIMMLMLPCICTIEISMSLIWILVAVIDTFLQLYVLLFITSGSPGFDSRVGGTACMFSPCQRWFSPGTPAFSQRTRKVMDLCSLKKVMCAFRV